MTDNEAICTAIVAGFTVLGAAIRWSAHVVKGVAGRVVTAIDSSTTAWTETSKALNANTQTLTRIEATLNVQKTLEKIVDSAVEEVIEETSGVHDAAKPEPPPRKTPAGGYHQVNPRAKSRGF